jgi:hypothetical protein
MIGFNCRRLYAEFFFFLQATKHYRNRYRNVLAVPTVRRPSPTVCVRTAIEKRSRRSVGDRCNFFFFFCVWSARHNVRRPRLPIVVLSRFFFFNENKSPTHSSFFFFVVTYIKKKKKIYIK